MRRYQICNRCIMDTSDPTIRFDSDGICNYCTEALELISEQGYKGGGQSEAQYNKIIKTIKNNQRDKAYDCVIGVSGGVDSAFLLHLAHKEGLIILAVHVDAGWNSNMAVSNIQKLCTKMKIDLKTIVIDWKIFKELQRAYMFSGLPNLDVPQDHVFFTALYQFAEKYKIKYVLTGSNAATESILPAYLVYDALDYKSLKDVYRKNKRKRAASLKDYPHMTYLKKRYYYRHLKIIRLLNYIDYSKTEAMDILTSEYGWEYYGGKHWESRFTKFVQTCYLPQKFGFQKSRAHLSNLVVNGEISRDEALYFLEKEERDYPEKMREADRKYILKKLDITADDWNRILASPNKTEDDYKNNKKLQKFLKKLKRIVRKQNAICSR